MSDNDEGLGPTDSVARLLAMGLCHHQAGRLDDAERAYRRVLAHSPEHANALHLLGVIAHQAGREEMAIDLIGRAIIRNDRIGVFFSNRGVAQLSLNHFAEAAADCRRAIALDSRSVGAYNTLGKALQAQGLWQQGASCHRQCLVLKPDHAEAWRDLGVALHESRRPEDEARCYRRALRLDPSAAMAAFGLGALLRDQGRYQDAIALFRHVLCLAPHHVEAWNNLGTLLSEGSQVGAATVCLQRAIWLRPEEARAYYNLGNALRDGGRPDRAADCFQKALQLDPEHGKASAQMVNVRRMGCDWRQTQDEESKLLAAIRQDRIAVPPILPLSLPSVTPDDQLLCARRWADYCARDVTVLPPRWRDASRGRLHLGYLSADFRSHPVAHLAVELFESHDRTRFQVTGYSIGPDDKSPLRARLESAFERFVDLRTASHAEAAAIIRADEVDILIDLSGYTQYARPQIPAFRPAPLQVNFLGFPGTMGTDVIDYIIADPVVAPMDQARFFAEKIVHLPGSYQPNDSRRPIASDTPNRADCGLPETGFVFCCFNNNFKITPDVFTVWMRLLGAVPGSLLWLLAANEVACTHLRREAQARGVAADRLIFAPRRSLPEHLARHRHADLFLDTLPYNAHTTASDALWAGLPVLTCTGTTFAGRVSASLLTAAGLPELITPSLPDYEKLALRLATSPAQLADLRRRLADNRRTAPLFDGVLFARHLEMALEIMWRRWCDGLPPEAFAVDG
jgi:predicted O-linked N-acetylglucosamine transferase (SPINDLY family)